MTKNPLAYGIIAAAIFLTSCSADVVFEEPMPRQSQLQKNIPRQFHGTWIDENEENWIVDSNGILKDDEFMKNDAETQIRTTEDHIFLNMKNDAGWELYVAQLDENTLDIYSININDDRLIKKLDRLTDLEITYDEDGKRIQVKLNPSNREFKKMVKRKLFSYQGSLTRL
jgi:hypothetical protein